MSKRADRNVPSTGVVTVTSHFLLNSPEDYTVLFVKRCVLTVVITDGWVGYNENRFFSVLVNMKFFS